MSCVEVVGDVVDETETRPSDPRPLAPCNSFLGIGTGGRSLSLLDERDVWDELFSCMQCQDDMMYFGR